MISFIKSHWIFIIVVICALGLAVGYFSGTNSKVYNMMIDTLRSDQSKVVKNLEDSLASSELEIGALQDAKAQLQKDKATLQRKADESSARVTQLNGEIDALNHKYAAYLPPASADDIIWHLNTDLGLSSIHRRNP